MSLGHLVAGGKLWSVSHLRRLVLFSPQQKKKKQQRHLTRLRAKGTHLVAHDLACHYPSAPALILKQQIPHQTNHHH